MKTRSPPPVELHAPKCKDDDDGWGRDVQLTSGTAMMRLCALGEMGRDQSCEGADGNDNWLQLEILAEATRHDN